MIRKILSLASGLVGIVTGWMKSKERAEYREAGANEERLAQIRRAMEAENEMESVEPSGKSGTVDRLRSTGF